MQTADFIREGAEDDRQDFIVYEELGHADKPTHSISCDVCHRKLWAPCISYWCGICNNGEFDICESCWQRGASCKNNSHDLKRKREDPQYEDRILFSKLGESKIPSWEGNLGTLQSIRRKSFCPLCRIVDASINYSSLLLKIKPEDYDDSIRQLPTDEFHGLVHINLAWAEFGWNMTRRQTQGRYLVPRSSDNPVGDPIVLLSESSPFSTLTGSRVESHQVYYPMLKSWLRDCEENHGPSCHGLSRLDNRPVRHFRVIDVQKMCLVQADITVRFAALSYVWGGPQELKSEKNNIKKFETPNFLRECYDKIPRTIKDAIQLVSELGERYLWVDALCIVQDDDTVISHLIGVMDLIYGCAAFTIIAGAGSSVDAALPGVQPRSRPMKQNIEEISTGLKLMVLPNLERELLSSTYNTRGWTFQEQILSRRRFIFAASRIYFQCECRIYREDFCPDKPDVVSHLLQNSDRSTSLSAYLGWRGGRMYGPGGSYERLVHDYLSRSLSRDDDIFRAFHGVLNLLESKLGTQFLAGLPKSRLDSSILWAVKRKSTRRKGFPSFSWLGWKGKAIWPEQDDAPHPFLHLAITDDKTWFLNNTYIEWHERAENYGQKRVFNGSKLAYSWVSSVFTQLKPKDNARNSVGLDRMGRPVDYEWKRDKGKGIANKTTDVEESEKDSSEASSYGPNILDNLHAHVSGAPQMQSVPKLTIDVDFLSFMAVTVLVELQETQAIVKSDKNFRYISLHDLFGEHIGLVTVTDQFRLKTASSATVIILSSIPQNAGLSLSQSLATDEKDRTLIFGGIKSHNNQLQLSQMLKCAYNVMLVEQDSGFAVRVGTGFIIQEALGSLEPKWQHIILV